MTNSQINEIKFPLDTQMAVSQYNREAYVH